MRSLRLRSFSFEFQPNRGCVSILPKSNPVPFVVHHSLDRVRANAACRRKAERGSRVVRGWVSNRRRVLGIRDEEIRSDTGVKMAVPAEIKRLQRDISGKNTGKELIARRSANPGMPQRSNL